MTKAILDYCNRCGRKRVITSRRFYVCRSCYVAIQYHHKYHPGIFEERFYRGTWDDITTEDVRE